MHQSIPSINTPPPPRVTPGVLHSVAAPGPGFILDDLPRGPGFLHIHKITFSTVKKYTFTQLAFGSYLHALHRQFRLSLGIPGHKVQVIDHKEQCSMKICYLQKSIGLVFIAISSGIKSSSTLLSPNLLFLCLTTTYIEYVIHHCHKIPLCKRI